MPAAKLRYERFFYVDLGCLPGIAGLFFTLMFDGAIDALGFDVDGFALTSRRGWPLANIFL